MTEDEMKPEGDMPADDTTAADPMEDDAPVVAPEEDETEAA